MPPRKYRTEEERRGAKAAQKRLSRQNETDEHRETRLTSDARRKRLSRQNESIEQRRERNAKKLQSNAARKAKRINAVSNGETLIFEHSCGDKNAPCEHCQSLNFKLATNRVDRSKKGFSRCCERYENRVESCLPHDNFESDSDVTLNMYPEQRETKPIVCQGCLCCFSNFTEYEVHQNECSPVSIKREETNPYPCSMCCARFKDKCKLATHVLTEHSQQIGDDSRSILAIDSATSFSRTKTFDEGSVRVTLRLSDEEYLLPNMPVEETESFFNIPIKDEPVCSINIKEEPVSSIEVNNEERVSLIKVKEEPSSP